MIAQSPLTYRTARSALRDAIAAHRRETDETRRAELAAEITRLQAVYHAVVAEERAKSDEEAAVYAELRHLTTSPPTEPRAIEAAAMEPASRGLARAASSAWSWLWGDTRVSRVFVLLAVFQAFWALLRWVGVL